MFIIIIIIIWGYHKKKKSNVRKLDSKIVILKKKFPFHMNVPYS